jgi:hypothetical protein
MAPDDTFVEIVNNLDDVMWLCTTTYPGAESPLIPTKILGRQSRVVSAQDARKFWHGPYPWVNPHIYVSKPGRDLRHACAWNDITIDGVSHLPFQVSFVRYDPATYADAISDASIFPNLFYVGEWGDIGYTLRLECSVADIRLCYPETVVWTDSTAYIRFLRVIGVPSAQNNVRIRLVIDPAPAGSAWSPQTDTRFPSLPSTLVVVGDL